MALWPVQRSLSRGFPALAALGAPLRRLSTAAAPRRVKHVVLGGGVSGGYAMAQFARLGVRDVLLVGAEPVAPYERPALSKGYLAPENPARLPGFHTCVGTGGEAHDEAWYNTGDWFEPSPLKLGAAATEVDLNAKQLTLDTGEVIEYEQLLVATGSHAVNPYGDTALCVRSEADAANLVAKFNELVSEGSPVGDPGPKLRTSVAEPASPNEAPNVSIDTTVAIIGGGLLGVELAGALSVRCDDITLLCRGEALLEGVVQVPPGAAEDLNTAAGADLVFNAAIDTVQPNLCHDSPRAARRYRLTGAGISVTADLVVAAVGASPASELVASQLELTPTGRILTDARCRTSDPSVFAAGDVAALPDCDLPLVNVTHARNSAEIAVHNMAGMTSSYEPVLHAYSRISNRNGGYNWMTSGFAVHLENTVQFRCVDGNNSELLAFWTGTADFPGEIVIHGAFIGAQRVVLNGTHGLTLQEMLFKPLHEVETLIQSRFEGDSEEECRVWKRVDP
eukprot:m.107949 g.107949  ORF g.107949 m.107949 type:complete len:508 (+) comp12780_c0_seq1:52-1575(+)